MLPIYKKKENGYSILLHKTPFETKSLEIWITSKKKKNFKKVNKLFCRKFFDLSVRYYYYGFSVVDISLTTSNIQEAETPIATFIQLTATRES